MTVFTVPQRSEAAYRYAEGATLQELATAYGVSRKHVRKAVAAEGVPIRSWGKLPQPKPATQSSRRTTAMSDFEVEVAAELYARGKTLVQIAALLDSNRTTVDDKLRAAGVQMRDVRSPRASRIRLVTRRAILAAWAEGKTRQQIMAEVNTTALTVGKVLKAEGLDPLSRVRRIDHDRVRALRAQGWTMAAIGADQGTRAQYVWGILNGREKCCSIPGACRARMETGTRVAATNAYRAKRKAA